MYEEAHQTLRQHYWQTVRELANDIQAEWPVREEALDRVDEWVGQTEWVIYTHHNLTVLSYCSGPASEAYTELATSPLDSTGGVHWAALAHSALAYDVRELLEILMDDDS